MAKYLDMAGAQKIIDWAKRSFAKAVYARDCIEQDSEGYLDVKYDVTSITQNANNQLTLAKTYTEVVDSDGNVIDKVTLDLSGGKAVWSINWDKHTVSGSASNGTFLADVHYVSPGETVTIYNVPDSGCAFSNITVVPSDLVLTKVNDNQWTFEMPSSDVSIAISNISNGVDTGKLYYGMVNTGGNNYKMYLGNQNHYWGNDTDISQYLDGGNLFALLQERAYTRMPLGYFSFYFLDDIYPRSCEKWFNNGSAWGSINGWSHIKFDKCISIGSMFKDASINSPDMTTWNWSKVKTADYAFYNYANLATATMPDYINLSNCTSASYMFAKSGINTVNLSNTSFKKMYNMSSLCEGATSLTGVLFPEHCDFTMVNMANMFNGCTKLGGILCSDDWSANSRIVSSTDMFKNCSSLTGYTATNPTDKSMAKPITSGGYFSEY